MAEMDEAIQLDFGQAMQDFRTMFPNLDPDIIEAVLRSNKGAVHATIDHLLNMVSDETDSKGPSSNFTSFNSSKGKSPISSSARGHSYVKNSAMQSLYSSNLYKAKGSESKSFKLSPRGTQKWCPPMLLPLPADFLKISISPHQSGAVLSPRRLSERLNENAMAREAIGASDAELAQYLHDERIALFLQNDEFINELRSDQDFMSALQREHEGFPDADDWDEQSSQTFRDRSERKLNLRWSEGPGGVLPPLDDATFKERLSNMGKVSKKKFAQIAKVFSRGRRTVGGGARSLLPNVGGGSGTAGRDLLMSTDSLIDDLDEERHRSASESSGTRNQL